MTIRNKGRQVERKEGTYIIVREQNEVFIFASDGDARAWPFKDLERAKRFQKFMYRAFKDAKHINKFHGFCDWHRDRFYREERAN